MPKLDPATIREQLSLSSKKFSNLLNVSSMPINLADKQQAPLNEVVKSKRLAKLQKIVTLGLMIYSSKEGLKDFLTTRLPIFNERSAMDLMSIGEYDRVIGALAADYEGLGY